MADLDIDSARDTIADARSHTKAFFFFVVKTFVFGPFFTFLFWYPMFILRGVTYPAFDAALRGVSGDRWHLAKSILAWAASGSVGF